MPFNSALFEEEDGEGKKRAAEPVGEDTRPSGLGEIHGEHHCHSILLFLKMNKLRRGHEAVVADGCYSSTVFTYYLNH